MKTCHSHELRIDDYDENTQLFYCLHTQTVAVVGYYCFMRRLRVYWWWGNYVTSNMKQIFPKMLLLSLMLSFLHIINSCCSHHDLLHLTPTQITIYFHKNSYDSHRYVVNSDLYCMQQLLVLHNNLLQSYSFSYRLST